MAFIGMVYKTKSVDGRTVSNVPYKKYDTPCWEGCCENELRISLKTSHQVSWLLYKYMPQNELTNFDFNEWSDDIDAVWRDELSKKMELEEN